MVQQTPLRVHVSVEETRPQSPLGQATILSRPTLHSAPRLQTANISNQQFHGMATYTLYPPSESANDVALPSEHPSPVKNWTCFLVLFAITTATLLSAVVAAGWSYLCSFSGIVLMRNMAPYSDAHYSAMWATSTVGGVIVGGASGLVLLALSRLDHHADRIWRYGFDPESLRSRYGRMIVKVVGVMLLGIFGTTGQTLGVAVVRTVPGALDAKHAAIISAVGTAFGTAFQLPWLLTRFDFGTYVISAVLFFHAWIRS
ncbi:hypothetical protein SCP_1200550 [Sparassis crispa]|uniref:Uncharacterized protein n=1 Tax=Sparassis crispa TaxID=139825 RepID=A0A401H0B6_9APHY|nr:hypothetical protein SCP_1200550 [Sparassis crispa]GBE87830.1 hypothetical protein SCP_1200550 [Sparassis crispa]